MSKASRQGLPKSSSPDGHASASNQATLSNDSDINLLTEKMDKDLDVATKLQQEEWDNDSQSGFTSEDDDDDECNDAIVAAKLHAQDHELAARIRAEQELEQMHGSIDGRAWLFVQQLLELHKRVSSKSSNHGKVETFAVDDMVFLAKAFLECQATFEAKGWPSNVSLAYHYTRSSRLDSIRTNGLMTMADRRTNKSGPSSGGAAFGDGVYTARNPFAFHCHNSGDVGLLVAVIQGYVQRVPYNRTGFVGAATTANTVIGNKRLEQLPTRPLIKAEIFHDELVLQTSSQCLPLFRYDASVIDRHDDLHAGNECVWAFHQELHKLIDQFFNGGFVARLERVYPSIHYAPRSTGGGFSFGSVPTAPATFSFGPSTAPAFGAASTGSSAPSLVQSSSVPSANAPPTFSFGPTVPAARSTPSAFSFGTAHSPTAAAGSSHASQGSAFGSQTRSTNAPPTFSFGSPTPVASRSPVSTATSANAPPTFSFGSPSRSKIPAASTNASGGFSFGSPSRPQMPKSRHRSTNASPGPSAIGFGTRTYSHSRSPSRSSNASQGFAFGSARAQIPAAPSVGFSWTTNASFAAAPAPANAARTSRSYSKKSEVLQYQAPTDLGATNIGNAFTRRLISASKEDCVICMQPLGSDVARLNVCKHDYHAQCIQEALRVRPSCPICRKLVQEPQGHSPSGTMTISYASGIILQGYEQCGPAIMIEYNLPSGTQESYHMNPGQPFSKTKRRAYLPNNQDGQKLLKRLKYAWMHGLTFTIGTSMTSQRPNSIIWSSIHHKTDPSGGPHGFPDPNYFLNCNEELDALGVPKDCP